MIEPGEASRRILARIQALPSVSIATGSSAGRVLASDVVARVTSPPWHNSSMDGYAARSEDIVRGVSLRVIEAIAAGSFPSRAIAKGEAARVMTGAPVPKGADTVIRHEDTDNGRDVVRINDARDAGRNVRKAGEDFVAGQTILKQGDVLTARHLGLLAAAGLQDVTVHRQPVVAIISSGDELVELAEFQPALAGKKIVSANSVTLAAAVQHAGGAPLDIGIARDDVESMQKKFEAAMDADVIVTTAGISVGDHDHVRSAFASLGGELDFWKVRMRPGAPVAFGMLRGKPWIGLSGNPVSALVTFELFVRPAIRKLAGARDHFRATIPVRLGEKVTIAASLMHFLRVMLTPDPAGGYVATLAGSQSSGVLSALANADALLILPGDRLEYAKGETHRALPFDVTFQYSETLEFA